MRMINLANGKREFEQKVPVSVDLVTQENVAEFVGYGKME